MSYGFAWGYMYEDANADGDLTGEAPASAFTFAVFDDANCTHQVSGPGVGGDPAVYADGLFTTYLTQINTPYWLKFTPDPGWHFTQPTSLAQDPSATLIPLNGIVALTWPLVDPASPGYPEQAIYGGMYHEGSIQGQAWNDSNRDGVRGLGEAAFSGVTVHLLDVQGDPVLNAQQQAVTTLSDSDGTYAFAGLKPGDYQVHFDVPTGWETTFEHVGNDATVDSDTDETGRVFDVAVTSGQTTTVDAGLHREVRGIAWHDLNGNGVREGDEPRLANVTIELTGANGYFTKQTDVNGVYTFKDVAAGACQLSFTPLVPLTAQGQGTDSSLDSDFDPATRKADFLLGYGDDPNSLEVGIDLYVGYVRAVQLAQQSYDAQLGLAIQARDEVMTDAEATATTAVTIAYGDYESAVAEALTTYQTTLISITAAYTSVLQQANAAYQTGRQDADDDLNAAIVTYNAAFGAAIDAADLYHAELSEADALYALTLAPYQSARDAAYQAHLSDPLNPVFEQAYVDAEDNLADAILEAQAVWDSMQQNASVLYTAANDVLALAHLTYQAATQNYLDDLGLLDAGWHSAVDPAWSTYDDAYADADATILTAEIQAWSTFTDALAAANQTMSQDEAASLIQFTARATELLDTWQWLEQEAWDTYTAANLELTPTAPLGLSIPAPGAISNPDPSDLIVAD